MAEKTGITWCHHTFNGWWGCEKVSPECARCYAERDSKRYGFKIWGQDAPRRFFGDKHWNEPLRWNNAALAAGERRRVFTNSMADVFEDRVDLIEPRARLFRLVEETPGLDWLFLTKRAENIWSMLPANWRDDGKSNVWLGTTAGTKDRLESQVPYLEDFVGKFPVLWVSAEPLLEDLGDLSPFEFINWWVVGGESGPGFRHMDLEWARNILAQVDFYFFKQVGGFRSKDGGDLLDGKEYKEFPVAA